MYSGCSFLMAEIAAGTACPRNDTVTKGGGEGLRIDTAGFEPAHGLYFDVLPCAVEKHAVARRALIRRPTRGVSSWETI